MQSHKRLLLLPFLALGLATAASAEQHVKGTDGLTPLTVVVDNAGPEPLACGAAVAHWYSVDLGAAAAGASVTIDLWRDPASGAVYALNPSRDRLPIERLWCGLAGRSWATRAEIDLPRRPGTADDIALSCAPAGERLACR